MHRDRIFSDRILCDRMLRDSILSDTIFRVTQNVVKVKVKGKNVEG